MPQHFRIAITIGLIAPLLGAAGVLFAALSIGPIRVPLPPVAIHKIQDRAP